MPADILSQNKRILALLVRHGRTALNAKGKMRAWEDPPLNDDGKMDAQLAGNILKKYKPKMIYASDLLRDQQTAEIIGDILGGIPYEADFGLRTANVGELSGTDEKAAIPFMIRWYEEPWTDAPSGESYANFTKRLDTAFFPKLELARDVEAFRPSVFVSHGRPIARYHSYYSMLPPGESDMPLPGGIALIRGGGDGRDDFEFVTSTEPILTDA